MPKLSRLFAVAALICLAAAPLRAQEAAEAEAAPKAAEAAEEQAAEAPEIDVEISPETRALAERYLSLPAIQKMNDDLYGGNVLDSMLAMQEGMPPEVSSVMSRILHEEFGKIRPGLEAAMVEAAAAIYSDAELEAMIAFYESPEGAAIAAKTAPFTQKTFEIFGPQMEDFQRAIVRRLTEELK